MITRNYQGIDIIAIPSQDQWEYHVAPNLNHTFYEMGLGADLRIYFATFLAWPALKSPCISISHGIFWDYSEAMLTSFTPEQKAEFFRRQIAGMTEVDACVSVDTNVRGFVAAYDPGKERKIHVIPNFVDTQEFTPGEKTWEGIKVLFPRRIAQARGVNEFMAAARALPEYDFHVCGQAPNEQAEEAIAKFHEDNYPNLHSIYKPMEKMHEMYREVDISIIPTRAAEGTSLSCLESMAAGLPIIATPAGGLPNLVIDQWNGLVVDLNHDRLAPHIRHIIDNPEQARKMGERNRQMAVECFDIEIWKDKWRKVIERVM